MQIRQAVAMDRDLPNDVIAFVRAWVEEVQADGSVAGWLRDSGQADVAVAPPVEAVDKPDVTAEHQLS